MHTCTCAWFYTFTLWRMRMCSNNRFTHVHDQHCMLKTRKMCTGAHLDSWRRAQVQNYTMEDMRKGSKIWNFSKIHNYAPTHVTEHTSTHLHTWAQRQSQKCPSDEAQMFRRSHVRTCARTYRRTFKRSDVYSFTRMWQLPQIPTCPPAYLPSCPH